MASRRGGHWAAKRLSNKFLELGQGLVKTIPSFPLAVCKGKALKVNGEVGSEGLQGKVPVPAQGYSVWARPDGPFQLLLARHLLECAVELHLGYSLANAATVQVEHLHFLILSEAAALGSWERLARRHSLAAWAKKAGLS